MTPERLADIKNGTLQPDKDIADLLTENAELRSELARVKEAARLLGIGCEVYDEECRYHRYGERVTPELRRRVIAAAEAINANPIAAALVDQARKETAND